MSHLIPRQAIIKCDPLTAHLKKLKPEQVEALQMMRGIYSNQVALSATLISLQHHAIKEAMEKNINE